MLTPSIWRSCFLALLLLVGGSAAHAQDDPNGQYVTIVTGTLNGETREINAPVEPTILRLFFVVQAQGSVKWDILSPLGKPAALDGGNVSVTEANGKRTIAIWDPRPGQWKVRCTGSGAFNVQVLAQSEVYACCLNLVGRPLQPLEKIQALQGSRLQANVYVSSGNLETVEFQLVSELGEMLGPVKARQADFSNPYNFGLLIEVPAQPARVLVRGREQNGATFQRVYPQLIFPQLNANAPAPETAPNVLTTSTNNEPFTEGAYRIVRAQVVSHSDEPLLSANGNPIGIRLKYAIRFPVEGYYAPQPNLYPERVSASFIGAISMRPIRSSVTPLPSGVQQANQVLNTGRTVYQRDRVYEFTVDLLPNYATYYEAQQRYCLQTRGFTQAGMRERFEREIHGEGRLRYRLSISGTDFDGRQPILTDKLYVPSVWQQSLQKEGAVECQ